MFANEPCAPKVSSKAPKFSRTLEMYDTKIYILITIYLVANLESFVTLSTQLTKLCCF